MSRFPSVRATDLDGRAYQVPDGLPPGPRVLLLAFRRWHQVLVEMWKAQLRRLEREYPALSVWEVPMLSRVYTPARPFIDGGMRAGIPDPEVRRHTLTAYVDVSEFAAEVGLEDLDTVYALLVAPDGEILWRGSGKPDAASVGALAEVLAWLAPQP